MTREEAIKGLKVLRKDFSGYKPNEEMFDMAIKALEQEPICPSHVIDCEDCPAYDPCGDAISRQAAIASIKNLYPDMPIVNIMNARQKWLEKYAPYFECENAIEHLPSVNPQPKTGHWIEEDMFDGDVAYRCSECNELFWIESGTPKDNEYNYCPRCGNKLVEPQESEGV